MSADHLKKFQFRNIPRDPPLSLIAVATLGLLFALDMLILHAPVIERL